MGLSKAQLNKKTVTDLKDLIEQEGLELEDDAKKPDMVEALVTYYEQQAEADDEVDDDEVDDTDDEADDEVDDEADDEPAAVDTDEEDDLELPEEDEVDTEPAKPAAKTTKAKAAKQTKYTEGGTKDGEKLLGAKEVATAIGTDAKSLRQFFRSGKSKTFEAVGAGGRYEFKESDVEAIGKEFAEYKAGKPGRGRGASSEGGESKPRASRGKGKAAVAPEQTIDEVEEIEDLEELEGDDDVEEIDDAELDDDEED